MNFLKRYKTQIAGVGLLGLALYQLCNGDTAAALASLGAGLADLGVHLFDG